MSGIQGETQGVQLLHLLVERDIDSGVFPITGTSNISNNPRTVVIPDMQNMYGAAATGFRILIVLNEFHCHPKK